MWQTDESHVRKVILEFNERGLDSLDPDYRGGRPRRITAAQRARIVAVAGARPMREGLPLTRWSLPRLAAHLRSGGDRDLARPPRAGCWPRAGLSFQRTRSWKASPDPDYEAQGQPRAGALRGGPQGRGGDLVRPDGTDLAATQPRLGLGAEAPARAGCGRPSTAATALATASAPSTSTATGCGSGCAAGGRAPHARLPAHDPLSATRAGCGLYWIQDGLSADWNPDVREFAAEHNIELVRSPPTPLPGRIEAHFRPINEFVVSNADYLDLGASRTPSPGTSSTATDPTATGASPPSSASSRSPPDRWGFRCQRFKTPTGADNIAYFHGRDGVAVQARSAWLITIQDGQQTSLILYQTKQEALEAVGPSE